MGARLLAGPFLAIKLDNALSAPCHPWGRICLITMDMLKLS
jgi:hypothetical protein